MNMQVWLILSWKTKIIGHCLHPLPGFFFFFFFSLVVGCEAPCLRPGRMGEVHYDDTCLFGLRYYQ